MSKIHGMMDIGRRSMMNSQTALQTVGHNIANKSTEGYSRQRVEVQSAEPVGTGKQRMGMGARTAQITRVNNPYLEKQVGKEQSSLGYYQGKGDAMMRVEQVYNEQINKGINSTIGEFFNSFREFSNNPESLATRTQVKESAVALVKDFQKIHRQLIDVQRDIDQQILTHVSDINGMTREIATLNEKIQSVEYAGGTANDERDRRDLLLKQLGEKINIKWSENKEGGVVVTAGNNAVLVAAFESMNLEVAPTADTENKSEGSYEIVYRNTDKAEAHAVTSQLKGGAIGGLLEVRDGTVMDLLGDLDKMAYSLASAINEVHSQGFDSKNRQGGDFFVLPMEQRHLAANLGVSREILNDVHRIAAGASPGSPGDNRIALAISELQQQKIVDDGSATLDEFYNSTVGKVGVQARSTEAAVQSQKDVIKQLANLRESISGVSLDEETTKLIEYQKAFDASARLIKAADEMFDTVLNLKRM